MAQTVLLKRSSVAGNVPGSSDLALGEIAVNTADGAVYIKKGNNDIVAVADNDILHIDTTNSRIGIGTTSPSNSLHVNSGTDDWPIRAQSTDAKTGIIIQDTNTTNYLISESYTLSIGNQASLHASNLNIKSTGNVGIGTTNPIHKLDVRGGNMFVGGYGSGADYGMIFSPADTASYWHIYNDTGGELVFGRNGTVGSGEKARFDSSGNLLVGTTSAANASAGFRAYAGGNGAFTRASTVLDLNRLSTDGVILNFQKDTVNVGSIGTVSNGKLMMGVGGSSGTNLIFADAFDEIYPSQNGVTTLGDPGSKFKDIHLSGVANAAGFQSNQPTNGFGYVNFGDTDDANIGQIGYDHTNNYMRFQVNNTEKVRIASSGNVGIGTGSPTRKLHVSGSGATVGIKVEATDGNQASLDLTNTEGAVRLINDGGAFQIYDDTDTAQRFHISTAGAIKFNNAYTFPTADGSANQVLQTDGSGNLTFAAVSGGGGVTISNNANNRVLTGDGTNANAEANLTFDSSTLGVTGNIAVSGTVDGRDIATDGSKLDGIEANATADQTASEILTAIKTVDGSGSNLDADKLDGLDSTSFRRRIFSTSMNATPETRWSAFTIPHISQSGTSQYYHLDLVGYSDIGQTQSTLHYSAYIHARGIGTSTNIFEVIIEERHKAGSDQFTFGKKQIASTSNIVYFIFPEDYSGVEIYNLSDDAGAISTATASMFSTTDTDPTGITTITPREPLHTGDDISVGDVHLEDTKGVYFGAGNDLQLYHNGSHSLITNQTGDLYIRNQTNDGDILFQADDGSGGDATYLMLDGGQAQTRFLRNAKWEDNTNALFGTNDDLQLFHNGSASYISQQGLGDLVIRTTINDGNIVFQSDDGSGGVATYFALDGGNTNVSIAKNFLFQDNVRADFGNDSDLRIYHDGSNSIINDNGTGTLRIQTGGTNQWEFNGTIFKGNDGRKIVLGDSSDLQIYHDGSNSYIKDGGTGNLEIHATNLVFKNADGSLQYASFISGGAAELRYNGSPKLSTTTDGIQVTSSNADNLAGPVITFNRDSASPADSDYLGQLKFKGENDADQDTVFAKITAKAADVSDGTEDGAIEFSIKKAGSNNINARFSANNLDLINGTGLTVAGDTTISGNLTVDGTSTTLNTATLNVEDKNITLNKGSGDTSGSANGAGITIQDAVDASNDATILWDASNDEFDFSHDVNVAGQVSIDDYVVHNGDSNSFLGFNAADTFELVTGGTQKITADANAAYLRYQGSAKAYTQSWGLLVNGTLNADQLHIGAGATDLISVHHDGTFTSTYRNNTGGVLDRRYADHGNDGTTVEYQARVGMDGNFSSIGNFSAHDFRLRTNNLDRMTVDGGGDVGIGTTTPNVPLEIHGADIATGATTTASSVLRLVRDVVDPTHTLRKDSAVDFMLSRQEAVANNLPYTRLDIRLSGTTDSSSPTLDVMSLLHNGNVGIGTTSPQTKLHVEGITRITENSQTAFYGGDYVRVFGNQYYDFRNSGGSTKARINVNGNSYFNAGNVGIGTASPSHLLHLKDTNPPTILFEEDSGGTQTAKISYSQAGQNALTISTQYQSSSDSNRINFAPADNLAMTIRGGTGSKDGFVGIGTEYPEENLEIHDTTMSTISLSYEGNSGNGSSIDFNLRPSSAIASPLTSQIKATDDGAYRQNISFSTKTSAAASSGLTTRMMIKADGKVGIGTTSPSLRLHSKDTGNYQLDLDSGGTRWRMGAGWSGYYQNHFLLADTANGIRMVVDTNGDVGIGTTNPIAKLDVLNSTANAPVATFTGTYTTNGNVALSEWQRSGGAVKANFAYVDSTTDMEFGTTTSHGLGIKTGNTRRLTITSGGSVGIGTTSPSTKLHIDQAGNTRNDGLFIERNGSTYGLNLYVNSGGYGVIGGNGGFTPDIIKLDFNQEYVGIGTEPSAKLQVEEYGIDTTSTSSTATTQIAIHTFAAATFRSARFTVQVTNSTDSTYHTTELLLVHNGTTANITEFGEIHTGSAVEATFDADISSGNVRLLATPASTDTMAFKVVCHSITT